MKLGLTEMAHQSHMGLTGRFQAQKDRGFEEVSSIGFTSPEIALWSLSPGSCRDKRLIKNEQHQKNDQTSSTLVFISLKSLKVKIHFKNSTGR